VRHFRTPAGGAGPPLNVVVAAIGCRSTTRGVHGSERASGDAVRSLLGDAVNATVRRGRNGRRCRKH
jgi:hypothetical protein